MSLYRQTWWAKKRTSRDVRRMLRNTPITFHAWKGRTLIAFARLLTDFTYRAVLYDVIVDRNHQGEGIGRRLVEAIQAHPKLKRITAWYLWTSDKHAFYEKLGWMRRPKNFMEFVPKIRQGRPSAKVSVRRATKKK
jgi:GNAT superfamily N-acetyltransferase